ncbi:copper resistance system multicopper oxidase [Sphingomicrobium nitratireducens]|uniref:copper resistance system multicopper oxidase n=1 Tax=Sphingomicrobium nitratireducens TaxID=2964666 RepID=UPI0022409A5A|nr:copper resistance system multicopper oxidase [Sphingomicrobium nitratireducens]
MIDSRISRRSLLALGGFGATGLALPVWARGGSIMAQDVRKGFDEARGPAIDLHVEHTSFSVGGQAGHAVAVNGSIPGPLLRLQEGTDVRLAVHNMLGEDTSIHWHGLLLPFQLDGVPGVSFPGIKPGKTFVAEFPVRQSGTYWWHSHSGLQEQVGHYGPIVVDPAGGDSIEVTRDYVVVLSEFSPMHPHVIFDKLKKAEGYFNYQKRTWSDDYPLTDEERREWARMRMMPTDILDVTASTYTYLLNGHGPKDGLEYAFRPGERVRLRFINAGAMTFFNVRIPGLPMSVVHVDGQPVSPLEVDEFQIGPAETYDVVVEPGAIDAYTLVAEAMDRSGMGVATLASRPGARAAVPALRSPPILTMTDMGHGTMAHGGGAHAGHDMGGGNDTDTSGGMKMRDTSLLPPTVDAGVGMDMVAMNPVSGFDDPGLGLREVDHRVLTYADLKAAKRNKDPRRPSRRMEIHLTGNMERYMWSFDGKKFSAVADQPIRFAYNERVRVKLVNDTMMVHPIHLHGHFFELVNGAPEGHQPLKHTVAVQPGKSVEFDLTADEPGDWAFHCHLLYHMHAGMFQIVTVSTPSGDDA